MPARAQEAFRGSRRKRRTAIRAYGRARAVHRLQLKHADKPMTTAEALRELATQWRTTSSSVALLIFGFAIGWVLGLVLFNDIDYSTRHPPFLAACTIVVTIIYAAGEGFGRVIEYFAEYIERK